MCSCKVDNIYLFRELRVQNISSESLQLWSGRGIIELPHQGSAVYGDSRSGAVITADPSTGESGDIMKPFTLGQNSQIVLEKQIFLCVGVIYEDPEDEVLYIFDYESGLLLNISSTEDDSAISVEYNNLQQPMIFSHSNGFRMRISYTENGLISYVDILDGNDNVVKSR